MEIKNNKELAELINDYINQGWLVIFEKEKTGMIPDLENTVYPPGTDKNLDFHLSMAPGPHGIISFIFCKKNQHLQDYFKYLSKERINVNDYSMVFIGVPSPGYIGVYGMPLMEDYDYTPGMWLLINELTGQEAI